MSKGKIIYIGGFELPDKNAAAHRVVANGKLLEELGFEVIYIGIDKSINKFNSDGTSDSFGFKTYNLPYPKSITHWIRFITTAVEFKEIAKKHTDVISVICYNYPAISMWNILQYCKKRKIKVFSDTTEWFKATYKTNVILELVKSVDNYLKMYVIHKRINGVISISQFIHDFNLTRGISSLKLPPLVDLQHPKWTRTKHAPSHKIQLVYAGAAFSLKYTDFIKDRLDIVVKTLSLLCQEYNNFEFKIIGCTQDEFLATFPSLEKDIDNLCDKILFCGKKSHLDTIDLIKQSDFSVFVREETIITKAGFPTKFVESISCGIPIITNENSNVLDYLIEGKNGFQVEISSEEKTKELFRKVLNLDRDSIESMKDYTFKSELFDFRNFSNEVENFLKLSQ